MLAASEVSPAVAVPEGTWVFPLLHSLQAMQRAPRSFGPLCLRHEKSLVGCAEEYPVFAVVIAQRRSPRTAGIALIGIPFRHIKTVIHLRHNAPVHHITALQYLHAHEMEVARHHIVFLPHAYHVGVRIVSVKHGVTIRTVALITPLERIAGIGSSHCHGQQ